MTRQHDPKASLYDIFECARNCLDFTKGMSFEDFEKDLKTVSAVLHQLMIIGEAVKRLGFEFTKNYPNVPWKKMAGMRDVLIHHYEDSDLMISWAVVNNNLPELIKEVEKILNELVD